jgi:hypothetical protein
MEILKDPSLKTPSFMMSLFGQLVMIALIILAFMYGVTWIVVVLKLWICIVFVLGLIPMAIDSKYLSSRLRWEQTSVYPAVTITLYWLLGSDLLFSLMWLVGAILLLVKYDNSTKNRDYDYSKRETLKKTLKDSLKKKYGAEDNVGDTHWHT